MGFLVLIAVGGILGWVAAILSRRDDRRETVLYIATGMIGAIAAGGLSSRTPLTSGLSPDALLLAVAATCALLGAISFARSQHAS